MRQRKIVSTLLSAAFAAGVSVLIAGCNTPESRPIMYGTDGNRGVTAPSAGVPQNVGTELGGQVTTEPGADRPNQTILGPAGSADPSNTNAGTIGTGGTRAGGTTPR